MNTSKVDKLYKIAMVQDGIESERDLIHAFAELIIRECMSLVSEPGPDMNDTERGILAQIKDHFGVQE